MSISTKIQWCDSTVNPIMGCDGCELWTTVRKTGKKKGGAEAGRHSCYAGELHVLRGGTNRGFSPRFEVITYHKGRMEQAARWSDLKSRRRLRKPWLNGLPRLIFVSDMGDALSKEVPFQYLQTEIIDAATSPHGRRHVWLWLTKQPGRMVEFWLGLQKREIAWPTNVWPGTSVTTQRTTTRITQLLKVGDKSTRRFLSVEPQWERLDLSKWLGKIDWCIQGGESGKLAKPFDTAWAKDLLAQCRRARTPYFLKQLGRQVMRDGESVRLKDAHGGNWSEWPAHLRIRELPSFLGGSSSPRRSQLAKQRPRPR